MSLLGKIRSAVHSIAALRPLLRLLGVKGGTVADKAGEAADIVDKALPPASNSGK